jgi:hypothetical protein
MTPSTTTTLIQPLAATDDIIYLADASTQVDPEILANIWGTLTVNAERIMYRERDIIANTVSGLLRGTAGTAVAAHNTGSTVYNIGLGNLLPAEYQDYVNSNSFIGNGSTTTFVATHIDTSQVPSGIRNEVVEVYVGGTLQTSGYSITADNPVTVVFSTAPVDGVGITILVRRGVTWYQQGDGTPSNGVPLQETNTIPARFLRGL